MPNKWLWLFPVTLLGYSLYSYTQVDPNLVLSSNHYYWSFQQGMWQLGYHNRLWSTLIFVFLIGLLYVGYWMIVQAVKQKQLSMMQILLLFFVSAAALMPAYPALSHDVFNYLMNAKIIDVYHTSPYLHAAWDFPQDPWLRFMNNIEVTTPYGYAWTGLGYLTYKAAGGDLQFGMLAFRLVAVTAVIAIAGVIYLRFKPKNLLPLAWFLFNPLVLIEAVGNMHNDIAMMAWFILGYGIYEGLKAKRDGWGRLGFGLLWLMSVLTKLTTIITPGIYFIYWASRRRLKTLDGFSFLTLGLLAVMLFDGSHRFYPWYFLWSLSVAPFARSRYIKNLMIAFSLASLLSYAVYLYNGGYSTESVQQRLILTFSLPVIYTGWYIWQQRAYITKVSYVKTR